MIIRYFVKAGAECSTRTASLATVVSETVVIVLRSISHPCAILDRSSCSFEVFL